MGKEDLVSRVRDYCDVLGGSNPSDVEQACKNLAKTDSAFIPSAGQIYAEVGKISDKRYKLYQERLPKPKQIEYSEEHRERMQNGFAELLKKLQEGKLEPPSNGFSREELMDERCIVNRIGANGYTMRIKSVGKSPLGEEEIKYHPYGYLTKAEVALGRFNPIVERTVPGSWLDKWEKENGRPYFGVRDAAE